MTDRPLTDRPLTDRPLTDRPLAASALPAPGHNGGPPLDPDPEPDDGWRLFCWRKAHRKAWKTPPREIALRRLALAEAAGMTYREYALEIMERGRYLTRRP